MSVALALVNGVPTQQTISGGGSSGSSIVAAYSIASAAGSVTASTPINFDNKLIDTNNAVTTGTGTWKFTAPVSGYYELSVSAVSGGAVEIIAYKNGSGYAYMCTPTGGGNQSGVVLISLSSGDYIDFRPTGTTSFFGADGNGVWQAICGIELIAANGGLLTWMNVDTSTTTPPNGSWGTIVFTNSNYDTASAYNASTGQYTIPTTGIWDISAGITLNAGAIGVNAYLDLAVFKNGTLLRFFTENADSTNQAAGLAINTKEKFNAGDVIEIQAQSNIGYACDGAATDNFWNMALLTAAGTTAKQIVVGSPQTADSTLSANSSFNAFSTSPTVSFTASVSGTYRIWGVATFYANNGTMHTQIAATSGSPTFLAQPDIVQDSISNTRASIYSYCIVSLIAGNAYTFTLEAASPGANITLNNSTSSTGTYLIAEQIS